MPPSNEGPVRLGRVAVERLGLRRQDLRRLLLPQAWREVAGEPVARRVRAMRVARGVLELDFDDSRWQEQLGPLLPGAVARLAGRYPQLGVRSFRVTLAGRRGSDGATRVEPCGDPAPPPVSAPPKSAKTTTEPSPPADRLHSVAARYLERRKRRSPR